MSPSDLMNNNNNNKKKSLTSKSTTGTFTNRSYLKFTFGSWRPQNVFNGLKSNLWTFFFKNMRCFESHFPLALICSGFLQLTFCCWFSQQQQGLCLDNPLGNVHLVFHSVRNMFVSFQKPLKTMRCKTGSFILGLQPFKLPMLIALFCFFCVCEGIMKLTAESEWSVQKLYQPLNRNPEKKSFNVHTESF